MSCTSCFVYLSETLLAFIRVRSRSRVAFCFAVWATTVGSVSASALSPGPVQVEDSIPYPEKMTFIGLSQSIELAASMGLAASAVTRGELKRYVHDATSQRRNLTPLAVFVREEFSDAIRGKGFTPEDNSTTDNRFRLAVRKYGFGMAELVSREVRPLMTLYAELITPDNKVLWSHEAVVRSDDKNLPAILPEQLRTDPDEQEMLLRAAAHRASEKLMENYEGKAKKDHE
ncbi:MAG TPA: hypothetical protein VF020_12630 [Chthoniobacterales bacterium]